MNALAGRDHRRGLRFVHLSNAIAECASCIDHASRADGLLVLRFQIAHGQAVDEAFTVFAQRCHRRVVDARCAMFMRRLDQVDQQSRIIELTVVVKHAAAQVVLLERRDAGKHFIF